MEENVFAIKTLAVGIIAAGTAMWGWMGWLILVWIGCMGLDYVSGTLAAMKRHAWCSQTARDGLWHKGGMVLTVAAAALTDFAISLILRVGVVHLPFDYPALLTALAAAWYTLTELGSVLENATVLTDRVPSWLCRFLKVAADAVEHVGEEQSHGDGK